MFQPAKSDEFFLKVGTPNKCKYSISTMKIGQVGNTDSGIRKSIQNTKYLPKSILLT